MGDRFWAKVNKTDTCWIWTGCDDGKGYGKFKVNKVMKRAHRVAWLLTHGSVDDSLELDHICRNRRCVNPAHLNPVSHRENSLLSNSACALNARKTHCKYGHEFTDANTNKYVNKNGNQSRRCKQCHRNEYVKKGNRTNGEEAKTAA